jgi:hypothetical protein
MDVHRGQLKVTSVTGIAHLRVVMCAAVLIGGCAGGQDAGDPSPTAIPTASPTSDTPSVSPSPSVRPLRDQSGTAILDPGTYVLDYFPVDLAFDIPDGDRPGWHVGMSTAEAAIVLWFTPPEITYEFAFWNVDNVYVDPCNAAVGGRRPPIGPSVDDLVAALSNLPGFKASAPVGLAVGDFRGKGIELTALDSGGDCPEVMAFISGADGTGVAPGDTLRVQILDVDGQRIVMSRDRRINTRESPAPDAAAQAELQQILDSLRIEPLS